MTADVSGSTRAEVAAAEVAYDRRTIALHWLTAVLVGVLWSIAQIIDFFPKGSPKIAARSVHIVLGMLLGVILLLRIVWRIRSGSRLPPAQSGVMGCLARIVHVLLYVGLVAVVLLGISNAWARGDSIFGLFRIPTLYASVPQLKPTIEYLHADFANVLATLAVLHSLVALVHQFILRDGVLRRMLPRDSSIPGLPRPWE